MQRRAAVALLAFVAVAGALVFGVYAVGGQRQASDAIASLTAAKRAFEAAQDGPRTGSAAPASTWSRTTRARRWSC